MANDNIEKTAKIGIVVASTANSNLDGTGTLVSVLTGINSGIRISRVIIKAKGDVTEGMVRLFLYDGSNTKLIKEIPVQAVDQRGVTPAFIAIVEFDPILVIPSGWELKASAQNNESFNIIAEGISWDYPVSETSIEFTSVTTTAVVSTANSGLEGLGTLSTLLTGSDNGTKVYDITIKATGDVTQGMIRLFLNDGSRGNYLFMEIPVATSKQSSVVPAFKRTISFKRALAIPNGYTLKASTELGETFILMTNSTSWNYV